MSFSEKDGKCYRQWRNHFDSIMRKGFKVQPHDECGRRRMLRHGHALLSPMQLRS